MPRICPCSSCYAAPTHLSTLCPPLSPFGCYFLQGALQAPFCLNYRHFLCSHSPGSMPVPLSVSPAGCGFRDSRGHSFISEQGWLGAGIQMLAARKTSAESKVTECLSHCVVSHTALLLTVHRKHFTANARQQRARAPRVLWSCRQPSSWSSG